MTTPFTAYCPRCHDHRTFVTIGYGFGPDRPVKVGCTVCGITPAEALVQLTARVQDDAQTIGEIAARVNTLDGEIAELRDELHEQDRLNTRTFGRTHAKLAELRKAIGQ